MANPRLWNNLPGFYQADIIAGAYGIREPNMAAGMVLPHRVSTQPTLGKDLPPGTILAGTEGNPQYPDPNQLYTLNQIPASPYPYQAVGAITKDVLRPIGDGRIGRYDPYSGQFRGVMEGAVQVPWDRPMRVALANGGVGMITMKELHEGKQPTPVPEALTPAMLATQRMEPRTIVGMDEHNNPVTEIVMVRTTSQKVVPTSELLFPTGQPAAAGAPEMKPLTPGAKPTPGISAAPRQPIAQVQGQAPTPIFKLPRVPTGITQRMRETAPAVEDLANRILVQLNNEDEFLGPLRSRWRDFWAGKVGEPDPNFTFLNTNVKLLQTLLMRMHTGSQSEYILNEFKEMINAGKQDPENLKSALSAIFMYANDVRTMSSQVGIPRAGAQTPAPPGGTPTPPASLGGGALTPPVGAAPGANVPGSVHVRLQRSMKIGKQDMTAGQTLWIRQQDFKNNPDLFVPIR
jgi:hypothetical protein